MLGFDVPRGVSSRSTSSPLSLSTLLLPPHSHLSLQSNPAVGFPFSLWLRFLRENRSKLSLRRSLRYLPRLLFVTSFSLLSSLLSSLESLLYPPSLVRAQPLHPSPIFILGAPRTGTTLLHNLLSLSPKLSTCSTFCAAFPASFLLAERFRALFSPFLPPTRPMDAMRLHWDLPQEDELGTCVLSAGASPYSMLYFMSPVDDLLPLYTLSPLSPQTARWTAAFRLLLQKLTLRASLSSSPGRLLLKSPVHTARVPHLLALFPDAKFVHVRRDPREVFRSAVHMANTTYHHTYLAEPGEGEVLEFILRQNEVLWGELDRAKMFGLLDRDNFVEVAYEDLVGDAGGVVERVWEALGVEPGEGFWERFREETEALEAYEPNERREMDGDVAELVESRWGKWTRAWGYAEGEDVQAMIESVPRFPWESAKPVPKSEEAGVGEFMMSQTWMRAGCKCPDCL